MSEDRFRQNLNAVSRALGERAAQHPDPVAEAMARRIKVQGDLEARDRRARLIMGGTAAAIASVGVTLGILYFAWPPERKPAVVMQETRPVAEEPKVVAAVAPVPKAPAPSESAAPAPPEPPQQVAEVEAKTQPAPPPEPQPVLQATPQPVPPPAPPSAPLARDEVREMQKRLLDFGFDPGPVDGNAGRVTQAALAHYQQRRGQLHSGAPDRDALEQLRQDPAPKVEPPRQVAQRGRWRDAPAQPAQSAAAPARRSSGFLDSIRSADDSISRWLNSLGR